MRRPNNNNNLKGKPQTEGDKEADDIINLIKKLTNRNEVDLEAFCGFYNKIQETTGNEIPKKLFKLLDKNNDGKLSKKELMFFFIMSSKVSLKRKLNTLYNLCDKDGDKRIEFSEFMTMVDIYFLVNGKTNANCSETTKKQLFNMFDTNKDGTLSFEEVVNGFGNMQQFLKRTMQQP